MVESRQRCANEVLPQLKRREPGNETLTRHLANIIWFSLSHLNSNELFKMRSCAGKRRLFAVQTSPQPCTTFDVSCCPAFRSSYPCTIKLCTPLDHWNTNCLIIIHTPDLNVSEPEVQESRTKHRWGEGWISAGHTLQEACAGVWCLAGLGVWLVTERPYSPWKLRRAVTGRLRCASPRQERSDSGWQPGSGRAGTVWGDSAPGTAESQNTFVTRARSPGSRDYSIWKNTKYQEAGFYCTLSPPKSVSALAMVVGYKTTCKTDENWEKRVLNSNALHFWRSWDQGKWYCTFPRLWVEYTVEIFARTLNPHGVSHLPKVHSRCSITSKRRWRLGV